MNWINYEDCYVAQGDFMKYEKIPDSKIIEFELDKGLIAAFVKPKHAGEAMKLGEMIFEKEYYDYFDATSFWTDFQVQYIPLKIAKGKKIPECKLVIDDRPNGFIAVYYRNSPKYKPIMAQFAELQKMDNDELIITGRWGKDLEGEVYERLN